MTGTNDTTPEVKVQDNGLMRVVEEMDAFMRSPELIDMMNRNLREKGMTDFVFADGYYWYMPRMPFKPTYERISMP